MSLVVLGEVGVFGGGQRGAEVASNSGKVMGGAARPGESGVRVVWLKVGGQRWKVVIVVVGLTAVMLRGFLEVLVLRVMGVRPFVVIDGIVGTKDGFVLVVVDHHAADHTAHAFPHHLLLARVGRRLLGEDCAARSWQRVLKALRWGRDNWDWGQSLGKERGGCIGALLGGHGFGWLSLLCLVWIKTCPLALFSPSQARCTEATLWVNIPIPGPIIYHGNALRWRGASIAAWGHFSGSSCLSGSGREKGTANSLPGCVVVSIGALPVQLPVLGRRCLWVTTL